MNNESLKTWLRRPLRPLPPVVSMINQEPPSRSRGVTKLDCTVLAARGGSVPVRLVERMALHLSDQLDSHLHNVPVDPKVVRGAQVWEDYVKETMVLTMEKSVEGGILHHACQMATMIMQKADNIWRMDLTTSRFCHPREVSLVEENESDFWIGAAERLPSLPILHPRDVGRIMDERAALPSQPLAELDLPAFTFSSKGGISDLVYLLEDANGVNQVMYLIEVKADTVLSREDFDELERRLLDGGGLATLRLVLLSNGNLQVISELGRHLTDIVTQLVMNKTDLGLLTNGQRSLIFEWDGNELCLSRQVNHEIFPLHRSLVALGVHCRRRRRFAPIEPTI
ncbi:hypothetical protein I317_03166 [Kwoniella heveanensis CBS 569]|nr:hypothetical protein I317_03166 [Kwoniella heveanensis CBS 569]